jgi:hypothetical protein
MSSTNCVPSHNKKKNSERLLSSPNAKFHFFVVSARRAGMTLPTGLGRASVTEKKVNGGATYG